MIKLTEFNMFLCRPDGTNLVQGISSSTVFLTGHHSNVFVHCTNIFFVYDDYILLDIEL
jgi:hypothetical protein